MEWTMGKAQTRQVECKFCFKSTHMPASNPPFGTALVCEHCGSPLVGTLAASGAPLSTPPDRLRQASGFTGRCLINPACPWCSTINRAIVAPAAGAATPWHAQKEAGRPDGFWLAVACIECGREFFVEWDAVPLPAACAMCHGDLKTLKRSEKDPRFCTQCAPKLAHVHPRRKRVDPPGQAVEQALLVGFSRTPRETEVSRLRKLDKELGDAPLEGLMLSGDPPKEEIELTMIAAQVASTVGRRLLGHDVVLDRVTWQTWRNLLLVKVWK
jgi:predicted amidophosphoribosyltransferase